MNIKKLLCALSALLLCLGLSTCAYIEKPVPDYDKLLVEAAVLGDRETGAALAAERRAYLRQTRSGEADLDFDELLLLARLIQAQAGEARFSDELRLCTGEVALNRVRSPEYPDTLEEVVFQYGQYPFTQSEAFSALLPNKACARAALRLLKGERMLDEQVLFQAEYRIGPIYAKFYDSKLDVTTYFCESMRTDLYPDAQADPQA